MSTGVNAEIQHPAVAADLGEDRSGEESPGEERRSFPLGRVAAFFAAWLGGSWLIVGGWLSPLLPGGWATVAAVLIVGALPLWTLMRGFQGAQYPSAAVRLFVLRPFWYAMLFLPMLAIVTLIGGLVGLPFGAAGTMGRLTLGIGAAVTAVAVIAGFFGSRRLVVRRLEVRMPRLPAAFDGLRVVQISDLHVGPHTSRSFLLRVADTVQGLYPGMIVITGDQVDDFARDVEYFNAVFGDLRAPLGTFAVAGNHDVYAGWSGVRRGLSEAGFEVLVNEAVAVEREGQRLWVAGTGDPAGGSWPGRGSAAPDVERTLAGIPAGEAVLALAHNPVLWPALASGGADLTLSGHTHYGQFAIPSRGWSMASPFQKLAMGWHKQGRSLLYINPGTNFWGIPFRLGTPPEVTALVLRAAEDGEARIAEASS